jgi:cytochrome c-type biogenesis protein CcmE
LKPLSILALVIIVIAMGATLWSFSGALVRHVDIKEAMLRQGSTVQVPGKIVKNSVDYDTRKGELRFDIQDMKNPAEIMTVLYNQPKPQNFDTATSVEAIGEYDRDGAFHANTLLIKCPSKYSDQSGPASKK